MIIQPFSRVTPGIPFVIPLSLFSGRLDKWNWGTHPSLKGRGDTQRFVFKSG